MNSYETWKKELVEFAEKLLNLAALYLEAKEDRASLNWEKDIREILRQFREDTLKIAVVGSIKSGKSTLINAWVGEDLLKRGAGVMTSIVTRLRKGEELSARVFFKGWDEVNADIEGALELFPASGWRRVEASFDIRRDRDREDLAKALKTLDTDQLISGDAKNIHSVYLYSYLEGYERIKPYINSDSPEALFAKETFSDYQLFVSDEILAAYVKDILITITDPRMPEGVELADCQGSDAPNPLHIAQVQDYLFKTHLIIYVISSRMGLRQADLRFINMIRKMGILDPVIFVLNTDLSEHGDQEDLIRVLKKVEDELGLLCPDVRVHPFSALYRLLINLKNQDRLSEKDLLRIAQWESDMLMAEKSQKLFSDFEELLKLRISRDRAGLLLINQAGRLRQISATMANRCRLDKDLLGGDKEQVFDILKEARARYTRVAKVQGLIKDTLEGSCSTLERILKNKTDSFFDFEKGDIVPGILAFIRDYRLDMDSYELLFEKSGFSFTLYTAFQDFRQALASYITARVNPEIVSFAKKMEEKIKEHYTDVARPYADMVEEVLKEYCNGLGEIGVFLEKPDISFSDIFLDLETYAKSLDLKLPSANALTSYNAGLRTAGHMWFGFYNVKKWFKGFFSKKEEVSKDIKNGKEGIKALSVSLRKICKDTEKQLSAYMLDYKENLKYQYVLKLSSLMVAAVQEKLDARFSTCVTEMDMLDSTAKQRGLTQEERLKVLQDIIDELKNLNLKVFDIQEEMRELSA